MRQRFEEEYCSCLGRDMFISLKNPILYIYIYMYIHPGIYLGLSILVHVHVGNNFH